MERIQSGRYDVGMLSYLHGFHAGNAADVLKHSVLIFCLDYLKKKKKPLLCVDTHAGAGFYDLSETSDPPNREWEKGIGRLLHAEEKLPPMIDAYVKFCTGTPADEKRRYIYPGSPVIMARELAKGDRLVCFELHPREAEALKGSMDEVRGEGGQRPGIEVRREDGLGGLKSLLPPPSRRGLIFIDPSWEEQAEYETIPRSVQSGLKRFPEGTFIIWYPLLALPKEKTAAPASVGETLFGLSDGKRCRLELCTGRAESTPQSGSVGVPPAKNSPRGMYGSGLVIYNPPWTLKSALEEALPCLAKVLGGEGRGWRLEYEE